MAVLLAEAATQCTHRVELAVARARFRVKDAGQTSANPAQGAHPAGYGHGMGPEPPPLPMMSGSTRREAAVRLHTILRRLLTRRERLRRARLRRQDNAIALARGAGRITAVQAELLDRLHRKCFVPASDLPRWCEYAVGHTVRWLRAAIRWAWLEMRLDYRRWSLSRCTPPDEDQLRTTDHSLESLVRNPRGRELADALPRWNVAPLGLVRLVLSRETRDELLVLMASMQDEIRGDAPLRVPAWLALCRVFHRAREAWRIHHQAPPAILRRILDRDGYQCAAPECTQRKDLQVHHVRYRSRGGDDRDGNRVTLCAFHHHHGVHGGLLRVRGELDALGRGLLWEMGIDQSGRPQRVYRDERVLEAVGPA